MFARWIVITFCVTIPACSDPSRPPVDLSNQSEAVIAAAESININTASLDELQRIPHIGESMAQKIIEHREKFGPFKRPEHLMLIQGISDARFRRIRHLIRVE